MLLFREKPPRDWLPKVLNNLPAVLIDHAHLERKAATSALNLEKYRDLYSRVEDLNAIAIEELQHFQLVLELLKKTWHSLRSALSQSVDCGPYEISSKWAKTSGHRPFDLLQPD